MIRRPPRSTLSSSSAASDVYKRQGNNKGKKGVKGSTAEDDKLVVDGDLLLGTADGYTDAEVYDAIIRLSMLFRFLSLIHISEPTRLLSISYAVFCLKKKKKNAKNTLYNMSHTHRINTKLL
eukprot:TRINITY_DN19713_c0_g1_i2.p1 TRINITY_DN19713_c0_g1~~TRINITY_DN19713_c0_g1_i2.p1  ORF type:complete len:122 (-),score=38.41 TRINITY_DN19713_c0_g1_i2:16-381(-)